VEILGKKSARKRSAGCTVSEKNRTLLGASLGVKDDLCSKGYKMTKVLQMRVTLNLVHRRSKEEREIRPSTVLRNSLLFQKIWLTFLAVDCPACFFINVQVLPESRPGY
jgi:hypothetical protein